ncbi:sensor histidine kinase [Hymenobacter sp. M29]|uniref:Sensor histidine kinase n=1 Tax=Hymenobacter mellowenesis TaxID=3063995 RepID=A0ABT9AAX6_9BACT|nr:sensor histidine kinase [Hymenobacter sp. M29]MDO7846572.1 sensor histidine kinase [Hymenobacter sp. M29]
MLRLLLRGSLLLLLPGLWSGPAAAQSPALVDSLTRQLRRATTDSMRTKFSLLLSAQYQATDTARTHAHLLQALRYARRGPYALGEAQTLLNLGTFYNLLGQDARAAACNARARAVLAPLYRQHPRRQVLQTLASISVNEGTLLAKQGNFAGEVQAYLLGARYAGQLGDSALLGAIYYNVGSRFGILKQPDKAKYYWRRAIALQEPAPFAPYLIVAYLNMAEQLTLEKQLPAAKSYLDKAARLVAAGKAEPFKGEYYTILGAYHQAAGRPQQARADLQRALALMRAKADPASAAKLLLALGQAETQLRHYPAARQNLAAGRRYFHQTHDPQTESETLAALATLEEQARDFPLALRYTQQAHRLQDSLAATASKTQVNALENQYQARQKTQQIRVLRQTQQLQQADLKRQRALNLFYISLVGGLLLLGAIAYLVLRQRRQRERQRQQAQARQIAALHQERQLLATEAMLKGQEEERSRLARDLHDGLGGMLSTVKLYLGSARGNLVLTPESAHLFTRSIEHLDSSIREMRRVARDLMPEALLTFGLPAAVRDLCDTIAQSQSQLRVQCDVFGLDECLPQRTELVVYRLVQELLNNVLKHAQARQVIVQLARHEQQVQVVVEDDGRGFDPAARPLSAGVGLRSLQARVDYLGGTLEVQSQPGQGTAVTIEFTLKPE